MTSPHSPTNRRRRRIVVTIAVLVLGLGWWFWPRVDQRFVGTWQTSRGATWRLKADGMFAVVAKGRYHVAARWVINGNELHIIPKTKNFPFALAHIAYERLRGGTPPPWPRYEIESVLADAIVLRGIHYSEVEDASSSRITMQKMRDTP